MSTLVYRPRGTTVWVAHQGDEHSKYGQCKLCMYVDAEGCQRRACMPLERKDKLRVVFLPATEAGRLRGVEHVLAGALLGRLA